MPAMGMRSIARSSAFFPCGVVLIPAGHPAESRCAVGTLTPSQIQRPTSCPPRRSRVRLRRTRFEACGVSATIAVRLDAAGNDLGGSYSRMLVSAHNFGLADGLFRWVRRLRTIVVAAVAAIACLVTAASAAANNDALGYPHFSGSADPIPPEPARYRPDRMMQAMYDAEKSGTDFWMDRLLARRGDDPAGDWLLTRGRAVFMKTHDPRTIGFGGQVAYWESIDNRDAYAITVGSGGFTEDVGERLQTPSYFRGHY